MARVVLVMGASGAFGSAAAAAFAAEGWQVRRYLRGSDAVAAAEGAELIVNALNPPDYHDWMRQIPAITALVMSAARASGARVLIPGNVYPYGRAPGPWSAETPHQPVSRKGRIRAEMEAEWRRSGLPVTILRGGDFIWPGRPGLMMDRLVLKRRGAVVALGDPRVRHEWAVLPDMARAAVALAGQPDLPVFFDLPFPGLNFSFNELAAELTRQSGQPHRLSQFAWWPLGLAAPFWELARELREMRYLYDLPHELDGRAFRALLPGFRGMDLAAWVAAELAANWEAHPPVRAPAP